MLHIVLYQPEIPPNTGNIIRLAANTGAALHLIKPYGFELSDRHLRRAGLDYDVLATLHEYATFDDFLAATCPARLFACSSKGTTRYDAVAYQDEDAFLFGPETRGLPWELMHARCEPRILHLPMRPGNRSLNLSNAVSVIVFEAWRQLGFAGSERPMQQ
jgi:tRNA (cytidine/uridine-2'-O-)-methyltransferase